MTTPILTALRDLTAQWTEDAERMKRYGAEQQAQALLRAAGDVLHALSTVEDDTLSLADAAKESGYTADHLGRLVRQGTIENVGRKNAPRIRRRDLPRKPAASETIPLREQKDTHRMGTPRRRIARAILSPHKETSHG